MTILYDAGKRNQGFAYTRLTLYQLSYILHLVPLNSMITLCANISKQSNVFMHLDMFSEPSNAYICSALVWKVRLEPTIDCLPLRLNSEFTTNIMPLPLVCLAVQRMSPRQPQAPAHLSQASL